MDISRCLFPTERIQKLRSSSSCCRRACPIYMECCGIEWFEKRRSNYFYWLFLFSFFFLDLMIQSFVSLHGGRKYFLCLGWAWLRSTNLSSWRELFKQLHSSGLTWNACERLLPILPELRNLWTRMMHARALLVYPLNSPEGLLDDLSSEVIAIATLVEQWLLTIKDFLQCKLRTISHLQWLLEIIWFYFNWKIYRFIEQVNIYTLMTH